MHTPLAGGPRLRTDTPPRSGAAAPIRLLRICLDDQVLGGVEVAESSTLFDVRATIAEDEIRGVPANYVFIFGGAPVSRRQECRRKAADCGPFLAIMQDAHILSVDALAAHVGAQAGAEAGTSAPMQGHTSSVMPLAPPPRRPPLSVDSAPQEAPAGTEAGIAPSEHGDGAADDSVDGAEYAALERSAEDEEAPLSVELQITDGALEGTAVVVGPEGARIGRHTSNLLVISETGISRYHCEICFTDGSFFVKDLGSITGTYFYLRPHGHFQMFVGLMVKLGETEFEVLSQSPPGSADPEQVVLLKRRGGRCRRFIVL